MTITEPAAGEPERDRPRDPSWTLRAIPEHLAPPWSAQQVGDLSAVRSGTPA
jgi:hypothetical protein